jgi:hypothetical protein
MLFCLAYFTIVPSHQLFHACSITPCLLFCTNVHISPCYFTLCLVASLFFLLFCICASWILHHILLANPTFEPITSPFKLLLCRSTYCLPLVFHFILCYLKLHPTTSYITLLLHIF